MNINNDIMDGRRDFTLSIWVQYFTGVGTIFSMANAVEDNVFMVYRTRCTDNGGA